MFSWLVGEVGRVGEVVGEVGRVGEVVGEVVGKVEQRRSCFTYKNVLLDFCWRNKSPTKVQHFSNKPNFSNTSPMDR